MSRDKYTTCTAVASDLGFTVLTYGTRQLYGPSLVRKYSSCEERNCRPAHRRISSGPNCGPTQEEASC
jgi:hypothetical protein